MSVDEKALYLEMIAGVRSKLERLASDSLVHAAVSDEQLESLVERIRNTEVNQLDYSKWPPLFGYIDSVALPRILELDTSIKSVLERTREEKRPGVTQFLKSPQGDARQWYGGLFDLVMKATLLSKGVVTELDHQLPNGRDHDALITINDRPFHLEGTVLTKDDEGEAVWDRYIEDKRLDPDKVLIRPGPYCPPNAKGPSPYYDVLRIYGKVFDKLTKQLDPARGQLSFSAPNVLLLSFTGPGMRPNAATGWALDELFTERRTARTVVPEGFTDISLEAWLDFTAEKLIRAGKVNIDWYCENAQAILSSVTRLSAVFIYHNCTLVESRINYNAQSSQQLTHSEMAQLDEVLTLNVSYWL